MEFSVTLILVGLVLACLWFVLRERHDNLPPGPTAFPLVGNLPQLNRKHLLTRCVELSKTYGPVMTLYLGRQRTVFLTGYDAVKEALVDQADDFTGRGALPFLLKATRGYGLVISNGERWHQLRRFTLSTLRDFGMGRKGMEEWIQEESNHLTDWIKNLKGKPFDPTFVTGCAVSNVICCLIFGERFNYDDKRLLHLLGVISKLLRYQNTFLGQMYNVFPSIMERLPGPHHTMFSYTNFLRDFVTTKIQEHKESLDPSSPRDLIDCFLLRMEQEKNLPTTEFHYDNLVSTAMNLFLAGTETTSSTIRYAIAVLLKHPEIQEEMQQEIDSVVKQEHCPKMEDRKSLPFTDAVIHEVQRFLDIIPFSLPHFALKDISFRGYTIPKGTQVVPFLHSVLKGDQWATPLSFNHKNFLDQNGSFKKNPAFLPFSAGKRSCVGEPLARMELFLILVTLVKNFTFSSVGEPDSINLIPQYSSFANVPCDYKVIATPR